MGFLRDIFKTRAKDWIYSKLEDNQVSVEAESKVIRPREHYINIWLRSIRIVDIRKGFNTFYPVVHSFVSVPQLGKTEPVEFNMVTTPTKLEALDAKRVDRVIPINKRMLGPIPFRGGDLNLEVGLFSIKTSDLAGPYLTLIEDISGRAGVSFVNQAMQFAEPLKNGINLLTGGSDESILEIGLSTTYEGATLQSGYYVVIRAERKQLDPKYLKVKEEDNKLYYKDSLVKDFPYLIFEITTTNQKNDWYSIEELDSSYRALTNSLREDDLEKIELSWKMFKRTVKLCPDILQKDAINIIKQVEEDLITPLKGDTPTSKPTDLKVKTLREYDIYSI